MLIRKPMVVRRKQAPVVQDVLSEHRVCQQVRDNNP